MSDSRARDDSRPTPCLELRPDALKWVADERDDWWRLDPDGSRDSLNLPRISADTGLDDSTVYRLANAAGERVSLSSDTFARLVRLGATERGVTNEVAFGHMFRIADPAQNRPLEAVAA